MRVHVRAAGRSEFHEVLAARLNERAHHLVGDAEQFDFSITDVQCVGTRPQLIIQPALFGNRRTHRAVSWNRIGRRGVRPVAPAFERPRPATCGWKRANTGPFVIIGDEYRDPGAETQQYDDAHAAWKREIVYLPSERTQRAHGTRRATPERYLVEHNAWMTASASSPAAVHAVLLGIPSSTYSEDSLAWDVTSHSAAERKMPDRAAWVHWLSYQQFSLEEFSDGTMLRYMMQAYEQAEADAKE